MAKPYVHRTEAGRKRAQRTVIALERESLMIDLGLRPELDVVALLDGREQPDFTAPSPEETAARLSNVVLLAEERVRRGRETVAPTPREGLAQVLAFRPR
jgi:hypothetical protein